MDDLISKQATIDELQKMYRAAEEWGRTAGNHEAGIRAESCMAGIVEMKLRIEKLPSAQPFNKGLWVKQELAPQTLLFCSLCGCKKPQGVAGNFCPNCGADMRGEEDGRFN